MFERDPDRISQMLNESAESVRDAVNSRVETRQDMNLSFDHPILLLQLLIFHEGYHSWSDQAGPQSGGPQVNDDEAGPSRGTSGGLKK